MRLLLGHDAAVAAWAGSLLGVEFHPPFVAIGIIDAQERIRGAAVFNDYTGANVELTVIGPQAFKRSVLRALSNYAFTQLRVLRVTARTRRSNKLVCKLLPKIGRFEGVARQFYGPSKADDAMVFAIFPDTIERYLR